MNILVIGYGSIGKRHYENFKALGCNVSVVSRREIGIENCYNNLEQALQESRPSHAVVANETSEHGPTLDALLQVSTLKGILVEKPLYSRLPETKSRLQTERVKVAYNLRFHPLIRKLKRKLEGEKVLIWNSYVGQNLSTWRSGRDYSKTYSASKDSGGGVLRDLSHELDLLYYLMGNVDLVSAYGGHFSSLQTDAEDSFSLLFRGEKAVANIHMNCIDHIGQRFLVVGTDKNTYYLNLVTGQWQDREERLTEDFDRNESYLEMAKSFLKDSDEVCSFDDGWAVNQLIEKAESYI